VLNNANISVKYLLPYFVATIADSHIASFLLQALNQQRAGPSSGRLQVYQHRYTCTQEYAGGRYYSRLMRRYYFMIDECLMI